MRDLHSWLNHLLKFLPFNTMTMGSRCQHVHLEGTQTFSLKAIPKAFGLGNCTCDNILLPSHAHVGSILWSLWENKLLLFFFEHVGLFLKKICAYHFWLCRWSIIGQCLWHVWTSRKIFLCLRCPVFYEGAREIHFTLWEPWISVASKLFLCYILLNQSLVWPLKYWLIQSRSIIRRPYYNFYIQWLR